MLSHFRSFNTTMNESAPYISFTTCPDFPSGFPESLLPLSILQSDVSLHPSTMLRTRLFPRKKSGKALKWPVLRFPGTGQALPTLPRKRSISRTPATLISGTTVTTCFSHRNLPYLSLVHSSRGIGTGCSAPQYPPTGIYVPVFP